MRASADDPSFAHLAFSAVRRLLVRRRRSEFAKDVEVLVLRHQLVLLARQERCPWGAQTQSRARGMLDWLPIVGRRHLETVLRIYTAHYNRERPHGGLALLLPDSTNADHHRPAGRSRAATDSAD